MGFVSYKMTQDRRKWFRKLERKDISAERASYQREEGDTDVDHEISSGPNHSYYYYFLIFHGDVSGCNTGKYTISR